VCSLQIEIGGVSTGVSVSLLMVVQ
jgi:hypothetical protein